MKYSPVCRTIQINGKQHYLWRTVDQDGEVVDVLLRPQRVELPEPEFAMDS
jgi:transposase-like protein